MIKLCWLGFHDWHRLSTYALGKRRTRRDMCSRCFKVRTVEVPSE